MKKFAILFVSLLTVFTFASCKRAKVEINGVSDLNGKKIGVQTGTTGEAWVLENLKDVITASFKSGIDASLDLKNGSLDAVVLDELPANEIVARNPSLMIIHDPVLTENKEAYAIAVKKGNSALLANIDKTITQMRINGDYEKLVNAFMPIDGNIQIPPAIVSSSNKTVKLGTNAAFPPFEYVEGRDVVGFDISMGQNIAKTCGAELEVVDMSFDSLIPALQANTIDFIAAGMSVTEERKKNVDFSVPYFESEQVIIVRK